MRSCVRPIVGIGFAAWLALPLSLGLSGTAQAQSYPQRPIHLVVPFAAGGITDVLARALGARLADAFGQQTVIENKPGANSQVAAEYVAKAPPDGHTLLVTADTTFVMNPHLYPKLNYDPVKDFVPITALGISPQALVVHPSLPVRSVRDLIEVARSKPGEINYGTFGPGSSGHLNIELLQSMTGTKFTPVHYRGAAPALTDVIAGHIQMLLVSIGLVAQPWEAGKLKVLGFGSAARLAQYGCADDCGERACRLRGGLLVCAGRAQGYATRDRRQAQCRNPADFQRRAIPRKNSRAQFHLFDRQLARSLRGAHPRRNRQMGQGDPRRQCEGGVTNHHLGVVPAIALWHAQILTSP
jgi:tripartite-type tricarboxylate transporter receptor subunit TctC